MITEISVEREKSDRLTVAKLNTVKQFNKQDHTIPPVQTSIQRMTEKTPGF